MPLPLTKVSVSQAFALEFVLFSTVQPTLFCSLAVVQLRIAVLSFAEAVKRVRLTGTDSVVSKQPKSAAVPLKDKPTSKKPTS